MEQSCVTDEEKINNSTQRMQTVLDTQQQLLQTVTNRLGKRDADEKLILQKNTESRFRRTLLVQYLMKKNSFKTKSDSKFRDKVVM